MIDIEIMPPDKRRPEPYLKKVKKACDETARAFEAMGYKLDEWPIDEFVLFTDLLIARETLAEEFDLPIEKIPETIGGTPLGSTLFMTDENIIHSMFNKLYSQFTWDKDEEFFKCLKHEIVHMFHEGIAIKETGSADGMGPVWFFEGLAIHLAQQFPQMENEPILEKGEIEKIISDSKTTTVSYLQYKRLIHSLLKKCSLSDMVKAAFNNAEMDSLIEKLL